MKLFPLVEVLVVNALLIALLLWITGDYGFRTAYWAAGGFQPLDRQVPALPDHLRGEGLDLYPRPPHRGLAAGRRLVLLLTDAVYLSSVVRARRRPSDLTSNLSE